MTPLDHIDRLKALGHGAWLVAQTDTTVQDGKSYQMRKIVKGTKARIQFNSGGIHCLLESGETIIIGQTEIVDWDVAENTGPSRAPEVDRLTAELDAAIAIMTEAVKTMRQSEEERKRLTVERDVLRQRIEADILKAAKDDDISDGAAQWCIDIIRDHFRRVQ